MTKKTANRLIYKDREVREKMLSGLNKISIPVIETIGPKGKNVMYESQNGSITLSNDGVTIAQEITVKDPIENSVIEAVKDGARRTNQEAGDGTSSTILFTKILTEIAIDLSSKGYSQRDISQKLNSVQEKLLGRLNKLKKNVKTYEDVLKVATISANNDKEIGYFVAEATEKAGMDGMVFLDMSGSENTEIEVQSGYKTKYGMKYQNLYKDASRPVVAYKDMPVIIFDKRLYYAEEAEHILRVALESGHNTLCVVAKDFIGDAPNSFIANHVQNSIKLVLVKVDDDTELDDLAIYLGGHVVSEAEGRRVDSITSADFMPSKSIFADPNKVLIENLKTSKKLKDRIKYLRDEMKKDKSDKSLESRLASLTTGVVSIRIGGNTQTEVREKMFRYEDSINAVRAAQRHGYLIGGGLSMYNSFVPQDYKDNEERRIARTISRASIERVAENAYIDVEYDKLTKEVGLNALTGEYESLLESGVIEPFKAVEMALKNAISVTNIITSIGSFIVYDTEDKEND